MSATEELRALLDGRGVKWRQSINTPYISWTYWDSTVLGQEVCAMDNDDGMLVMFDDYLVTPEQAVGATLGRGTCHMEYDARWSNDELYPTEAYTCSACENITQEGKPNFCPNCGRRVVA